MNTKPIQYDWTELEKKIYFDKEFVLECFRKTAMEHLHNPEETYFIFKNKGEKFVFQNKLEEELDSINLNYFDFEIEVKEIDNILYLTGKYI